MRTKSVLSGSSFSFQMFPPAHAAELFGLLGGGQRDGGWDGSGRPKSSLAILPGLTHYNIGDDPAWRRR